MLVALLFKCWAFIETILLANVCVLKKAKVNTPNPTTIAQSFITNKRDMPTPINNKAPCKRISGPNLSDKTPAITDPIIPATYIIKIMATR